MKKFRINNPDSAATVAYSNYTETELRIFVMLSLASYLGIC